jgi:hypothetical protein
MASLYRGYLAMVFPQDDSTLSALIVHPTGDRTLAPLRLGQRFDAAASLIPQLAPWTDPARFEPITDVMAGGGLTNTYRGQLGEHGRAAIPGLFFAGDAVCTTYPAAGRGVSLGLRQAQALTGLLADRRADPQDVAGQFDAWCAANIRPWYEDHRHADAAMLHRMGGGDVDIEARIPSDVVCAAAEVDPSIGAAARPYLAMQALPSALIPAQEKARAVLRTGWRPAYADGPTRGELAGLITPPAGRSAA